MAIRKRYVGRIRVREAPTEVFIEGMEASKITPVPPKHIVDEVRETVENLCYRLKISISDIDAFSVSNSMGGLYGIPEFMRYVIPSAFGNHINFFEVSCDEIAGLCSIVKAYELVRSGIYNRVCVISSIRNQLKNLNEIAQVIFSDITSSLQNIIQQHLSSSDRNYKQSIKNLFTESYERARKNNLIEKPEIHKKISTNIIPQFLNSTVVCMISSKEVAKSKKIKISFAEERTSTAELKCAEELCKEAYKTLGIKSPWDEIEIFEVYDFIPPMLMIWEEIINLGEKKNKGTNLNKNLSKLNPSGGVFFANCPPASSLFRLFEVFRALKDKGKGKRGMAISLAMRSLTHASAVVIETK